MTSRSRNPNWSRDETILLLDLHLRHPSADARHPEVAALSATLRSLAISSASATEVSGPEIYISKRSVAQPMLEQECG